MISTFEHKNVARLNPTILRAGSEIDGQPYHMRCWDEVLGPAHKVEEVDGQCLALIGKVPVILPRELAVRIQALTGQTIGVLRTDQDFRICVISESVPAETKAINSIKTFA